MYKVYYLVSYSTDKYYIGMTKSKLQTRLNQHRNSVRQEKKTPLYNCMRKYDDFIIVLVGEYTSHKDCCDKERELISDARDKGYAILNLADGGEGGFTITDIDSWKEKLKIKRQGGKPAMGMKHTEENKELFSKVSKKYWDTQDTYNPIEVTSVSFKKAKEKYGISKTHYHRLKRELAGGDACEIL